MGATKLVSSIVSNAGIGVGTGAGGRVYMMGNSLSLVCIIVYGKDNSRTPSYS